MRLPPALDGRTSHESVRTPVNSYYTPLPCLSSSPGPFRYSRPWQPLPLSLLAREPTIYACSSMGTFIWAPGRPRPRTGIEHGTHYPQAYGATQNTLNT